MLADSGELKRMRRVACLACVAISLGGCATDPSPASCPVPGHLYQWQADYCLFKIGTDDLIAAGPCLQHESSRWFGNACDGKLHYKQALCRLVLEAGQQSGSVEACVEDRDFTGPVVRGNGL